VRRDVTWLEPYRKAARIPVRLQIVDDLPPATAFWYDNANGLSGIAVDQEPAGREPDLWERIAMRKPAKPRSGVDRPKPQERCDTRQATRNRRLPEQIRRILRKHYRNKYLMR
jgi:hypothetical protein